jgi:MioC protein
MSSSLLHVELQLKLKILVDTMTSTADYADLVDDIEVLLMDDLDIGVFDGADALYLI